jgi:Domain of unknown function (DUF4398)
MPSVLVCCFAHASSADAATPNWINQSDDHKEGFLNMETRYSSAGKPTIALAVMAFAAAACASSPVPDETIAVAKVAVQRAEQSGAPQAAPVELASARDKLMRAEKANADHQLNPSIALANQATIDAQVAEAIAQKQRADKAATEFDASMLALRQESNRNSTQVQ